MITLFGNLESGNVHKVQLILRYVEEPYRRVDMSQTRDETRRPEFLDLNPIGKIPAVRLDDGDVLSESNAILFYFARATDLWPEDRRGQAEVLRWMFFEQYSHEPAVSVIRYLSRYTGDPRAHTERIAELKPKARRALETMDALLRDRPWVAGDSDLYAVFRRGAGTGPRMTSWSRGMAGALAERPVHASCRVDGRHPQDSRNPSRRVRIGSPHRVRA